MPEATPTVATEVELLLHVPPVVAFVRVIVWPTHTADGPEIAPSPAVIVIGLVAYPVPHRLVTAYDMMEVPIAAPVTTPVDETVAFALLADHEPPATVEVNDNVPNTATVV